MKKKYMKRQFIFDLDETLIDSRKFCRGTMAKVITSYEPHINKKLITMLHDAFAGSTIYDHYKRAQKEFNLKTDIKKFLALDEEIQIKDISRFKLFEGVIEILEFLKENGNTLHVCTNRTKKTLVPILKHTNISHYFESIVSCVDEGHKKPDPSCICSIINHYGGIKNDFIYFGDSAIDRDFAQNAGIDHIIFDQYLNDKTLFKKLIHLFLGQNSTSERTGLHPIEKKGPSIAPLIYQVRMLKFKLLKMV